MSTNPLFPCVSTHALHVPTRRDLLYSLGASLGSIAFSTLLAAEERTQPLAPKQGHFPTAKAKNVIFLMMEGGPSHIDTFDPKPTLQKLHLREFVREGKQKSAMESGTRYYVQSPSSSSKPARVVQIWPRTGHTSRMLRMTSASIAAALSTA
jgi:hypothetical protein